ncbi:MAG: hypothetical protein H0V07_04260 [Propionibacteriales bacterium]|nr:hypothetical protein [Propionibacteriales bacterium]
MLKQKPIVYLALVAGFGGLLLVGVPVERLLLVGFVMFMLTMHLGGHGHGGHGQGGHEEHGTQEKPVSSPQEEEVTGR